MYNRLYIIIYVNIIGTRNIQNVTVFEDDDSIVLVCQFAYGTNGQEFSVVISNDQNQTVFSRNFIIRCPNVLNTTQQPCSQETSFNKLVLASLGNFTLTVHNWEKDGSTYIVFSKQFVINQTTTSVVAATEDSSTKTESDFQLILTGNQN